MRLNWLSAGALCCSLSLAAATPQRATAADAPRALASADWHDDALMLHGAALPGGVLKVQYLEAFCRGGSTDREWTDSVISHHTKIVSISPDMQKLQLKTTLADGVVLEHTITVGGDEVDFRIVVTNPTRIDSQVQWAQPCIRLADFAGGGFADMAAPQPKYIRQCFLFADGRAVRLPTEPWAAKARYVPGQVYCPRNVDRGDVNPRPLSSVVPSCSLCGCYSADGQRILAVAWEPYQEIFQGVLGCLHCDFRIGGLKAGEQKRIRGKLYLVDADLDKLRRRFERDFPEQAAAPGPVDADGRPKIEKLGAIAGHIVETTPIVFHGRLYRYEWMRGNNPENPFYNPENKNGKEYSRFIDVASGEPTQRFADGYRFGSAYVDGDTVYVSASGNEGGWFGRHVRIFASQDMKHWESWVAIPPPKYGICNTSIAKADGKYVMMFEICEPPEETGVKFTARFATSPDLRHWTITPPECVYAKDRYTAPHCLRYLDGWYYDFYLEDLKGSYAQYVVRSRDLVHWESSPLNPVLRYSDADKKIANPKLTPEQRAAIAGAKDINNSDIDFCEFAGKLVINYSWGDQQGTEFLAEARYHGTEAQFLRGWFPEKKKGEGKFKSN